MIVTTGTTQSATASIIVLATAASAVNSAYVGDIIAIVSGTGALQYRVVSAYVGSTRTATLSANWMTTPNATSVYQVLSNLPINELVTQNIVTVLQQLQSTAGYGGTQLSSVERYKMKGGGNVPANMKAILYGGHERVMGDDVTPIQDTSWGWLYQVMVCYASTDSEIMPIEEQANVIRADIEKIMLAEIKNETFFGGYAQNCFAIGAIIPDVANEMPSIHINFSIDFRTNQYNPFTIG